MSCVTVCVHTFSILCLYNKTSHCRVHMYYNTQNPFDSAVQSTAMKGKLLWCFSSTYTIAQMNWNDLEVCIGTNARSDPPSFHTLYKFTAANGNLTKSDRNVANCRTCASIKQDWDNLWSIKVLLTVFSANSLLYCTWQEQQESPANVYITKSRWLKPYRKRCAWIW